MLSGKQPIKAISVLTKTYHVLALCSRFVAVLFPENKEQNEDTHSMFCVLHKVVKGIDAPETRLWKRQHMKELEHVCRK